MAVAVAESERGRGRGRGRGRDKRGKCKGGGAGERGKKRLKKGWNIHVTKRHFWRLEMGEDRGAGRLEARAGR